MARVYQSHSPSVRPNVTDGWAVIRDFYRNRQGWLVLAVTTLCTSYIGGAVMFWVHSIWLGEGGPDIPPVAHWLLDSSAALIGLTPALALILPFAARTARPWQYAVAAGTAFAAVTIPGPIAHDLLVARGTWLANHVTHLLGPGNGGPAAGADDVPTIVSMGYQFAIGVPTYTLCVALAAVLIGLLSRRPPYPARQV
jgi:hypothetical protein